MKKNGLITALFSVLGALCWQPGLQAGDWSGYLSAESRLFTNEPLDARQHSGSQYSLAVQPEFYTDWDKGRQSFTFIPFARWDSEDAQRSHADIRELTWLKAADNWELRLGIRKVFWGVTESQNLVDIINQTDLVESPSGDEKLGQPMLNLALIRDWGTVDLFLLPGFRERTFPGIEGRLRSALPVDMDNPQYESSQKDNHIDYAARWAHFVGNWDVGLSYFNGTSRSPRLLPGVDGSGDPVLIPNYDLIKQWGMDLQATLGNWLWKAEAINRSGQGATYNAVTAGFEYTFVGLMESQSDLGMIAELIYDDRGDAALTPFADDILLATRYIFNDAQSTEILFGLIFDINDSPHTLTLESSRRLGEAWKLTLEGQAFLSIPSNDLLGGVRKDDYLQLKVERFF